MAKKVAFGWRVPDFPIDGTSYRQFRDQILRNLDVYQESLTSAWIADHFFPWHNAFDQRGATPEGFTHIAYLVGRYPALTFGSIVFSQAYRPPALLAKMGATLQELSGGRFVLGIGAGWKENEYLAYGYDFPPVGVRMDQLEEAVQVIRAMWTQDSPSFHGHYYSIADAYCQPRPDPCPPIMVGGGGKKRTLRITARYADWWNFPGGTVEHYAELLGVLREHCLAVGRDYNTIAKTWASDCVAVAETHEAAQRLAEASPFHQPGSSIVGTPDEVAEQIQRFVDLGVEHFMFRFADFPATHGGSLFAREVLPRFV
jgi:alkanesulfonate monooxygenase SsuD/methylene tetrahydromethanopterin reductase-like flavin-dependent oxidoreductase (luciferase family)